MHASPVSFFLAVALSALPVGVASAQPSPEAPALLRAFLAETVTLEAEFSQRMEEADGGHPQLSSGKFYLQRPQRFRWDYQAPTPQLVVADGENLWLYDPDLEQATVRRLDDGLSGTPAMLLSGGADLDESFRLGAAYIEDGLDWVELSPRADAPDFAALRVGFESGRLAVMELLDALGQATVIRFSGLKRNVPLDPALFQFVPPPGADVIHDEGF
jgi:outer membrane lipoprotein carrier protein